MNVQMMEALPLQTSRQADFMERTLSGLVMAVFLVLFLAVFAAWVGVFIVRDRPSWPAMMRSMHGRNFAPVM